MSLIDLGTHTVLQIVNDWSKTPKKYAVSANEHGALTLIQMALKKQKRVILFFASGIGLTLEGAQGQTFAMQHILQLCNDKEFKEGDNSLIMHVIFPQTLIPYKRGPSPPTAQWRQTSPSMRLNVLMQQGSCHSTAAPRTSNWGLSSPLQRQWVLMRT